MGNPVYADKEWLVYSPVYLILKGACNECVKNPKSAKIEKFSYLVKWGWIYVMYIQGT